MNKALLCIFAALSLAGCVTPGGYQQQASTPRPTAQDDPSNGCFSALIIDFRFELLREKMAITMRPEKATLEMLSDKTVPNDEERRALSAWKSARETCLDRGASFRAAYAAPEYNANLTNSAIHVNLLVARLYAGEITFGQFNRMRIENATDNAARLASINQRERDANAATAARDDDRRRAAAGMALQNMQVQQQINQQQQTQNQLLLQQSQPRQTNCQRIGNQTNCTSY